MNDFYWSFICFTSRLCMENLSNIFYRLMSFTLTNIFTNTRSPVKMVDIYRLGFFRSFIEKFCEYIRLQALWIIERSRGIIHKVDLFIESSKNLLRPKTFLTFFSLKGRPSKRLQWKEDLFRFQVPKKISKVFHWRDFFSFYRPRTFR